MEDDLKKDIKKSFKMEMIGAGLYKGLSKQYASQHVNLSGKFMEFSNQEFMHAALFKKYYFKNYNKNIFGGFFWKYLGRSAAFFLRPVSLRKKLKKLHLAETDAVNNIENILKLEDLDKDYKKIMKILLPHEKAHASLYKEIFN